MIHTASLLSRSFTWSGSIRRPPHRHYPTIFTRPEIISPIIIIMLGLFQGKYKNFELIFYKTPERQTWQAHKLNSNSCISMNVSSKWPPLCHWFLDLIYVLVLWDCGNWLWYLTCLKHVWAIIFNVFLDLSIARQTSEKHPMPTPPPHIMNHNSYL